MGPWYECLEITGATGPRSRDGIVRPGMGEEEESMASMRRGYSSFFIVLFYFPGPSEPFPEICKREKIKDVRESSLGFKKLRKERASVDRKTGRGGLGLMALCK